MGVNDEIKRLITQNADLPSENIRENVINNLPLYMKHEEEIDHLGHEPIFNSDFPTSSDSLFEKMNWRADLDAGNEQTGSPMDFDAILQNAKGELDANGIWNESVRRIIKEYVDKIKTDSAAIPGTNGKLTISDIKQANAGKSFSGTPWVVPNINPDGKSYDEIRGTDKINSVLNSNKNLQFTKTTTYKYIRLLMPQYTRRVEVEDLNRNFWVIGQVLTGVCAYLFDDDSPLKNVLKQSLSEIMQLWENILYLWAAVDLLTTEDSIPYNKDNTIFQVVDIPRAQDKPLRDINNFVSGTSLTTIEGVLNNFIKMYPGMHLAFLLRERFGNYEKDYYHTETYPYVAFHDANTGIWTYTELDNYSGSHKSFPFGFTLRIDSATTDATGETYPNNLYRVQNLRGEVYGIREDFHGDPNKYHFYYPLSGMPPKDGYKNPKGVETPTPPQGVDETDAYADYPAYYGIVRISPTITSDYTGNDTKIKAKICFKIEDIARKLHFFSEQDATPEHQDYRQGQYDQYLDKSPYDEYYKVYMPPKVNGNTTYISVNSTESKTKEAETPTKKILGSDGAFDGWKVCHTSASTTASITPNYAKTNTRDSGFQGSLCDMITYRGVTKKDEQPIPPEDLEFRILNIGNFLPVDTSNTKLTNSMNGNFASTSADDGVNTMDINTYGIGCYYVPNNTSSSNKFKYSTNTNLKFIKNIDFYMDSSLRTMGSDLSSHYISVNSVTASNLQTWGRQYLEQLVQDKKNGTNRDSNVINNFKLGCVYITRIGVGYWTGVTATVWNSGIFCHAFVVLKNGDIIDAGKLFLFDGYWTQSETTFSTQNDARWRQLRMSVTSGKYDPNTEKVTLTGGLLQWNDHHKASNPTNNRPHCSFEVLNNVWTFANETWPTSIKGSSTVPDTQMHMFIQSNSIFDSTTFSDTSLYNYIQSYQSYSLAAGRDGYLTWGSRDYLLFTIV